MSAPITQREIYHETRNHLRLIEPPLERIGSGSDAQVSVGYVDDELRRIIGGVAQGLAAAHPKGSCIGTCGPTTSA